MPNMTNDLVAGFRSIRTADPHPVVPEQPNAIAIVGSTCSGKSTLVDAIRKSWLFRSGLVAIPTRYITRPSRDNDNLTENVHVSFEQFQMMIDDGSIGLHWVRRMEGGREERYGFARVEPGSFVVYSGNNAYFDNPNSVEPDSLRDTILLIGVSAPDDVREQRLRARSPDLIRHNPDEVNYRLLDKSENMLPHVHLVIENHGDSAETAVKEIIQLIGRLAHRAHPPVCEVGSPKELFRGRLLRIATQKMQWTDGSEKWFEYAERAPGVRVLVVADGKLLLTREWRNETKALDARLPGGKVFETLDAYLLDGERDKMAIEELARQAARKELEEETGIILPLASFELLHRSICGATVKWDLFYFVAALDGPVVDQAEIVSDEAEHTFPQWLNGDEAMELCVSGVVGEDRTAAFLMRYINHAFCKLTPLT